jgi:8-oxo-dGTP pyrophosphatase MutT (NUDIX family)
MTPPTFTRLARQVLVENRWHRYCRDRYVRRDGSEGDYYYVDHPLSCGIVPLFDDGSVALLRARRYLLGTHLWEFPIGGAAPGADALAVAQRELHEEAGLRAERFDVLGRFAPYKGVANEVTCFFVARGLTDVGQQLEAEEDIAVHRLPLAEAKSRLLDQDPGDGQSWCGLLLLERWLARGGRNSPA